MSPTATSETNRAETRTPDPTPAAEVVLTTLNLEEVILDPSLNLRDALDEETVARYVEAGDRLPPVTVFEVDGRHLLADGFHRFAAVARRNGERIRAEVRKGRLHDALWWAAFANLRHGLPLNRHERRRAIELGVKLHPDWSDRKLAETLGASRELIAKLRRDLTAAGEIPGVETRVGSDGRLYSVGLPRDPNETLPTERVPAGIETAPGARMDDCSGNQSSPRRDRRDRVERADRPQTGSSPAENDANAFQAALKRRDTRGDGEEDRSDWPASRSHTNTNQADANVAPWEGPDEFNGPSNPSDASSSAAESHLEAGPVRRVLIADDSEVLRIVARQLGEIASWFDQKDFQRAYHHASPQAREELRRAAIDLTARLTALEG
jgi:ParB-like chromosome segregation protein Spo0J